MYLTTKGLVLRVTTYNDYDALITILTHSYGKLTVKARGLRRKNSPLAASCQLLAFNEFTLFENRGFYTINEVQCIDTFRGLRRDIQKLSLGTYFAQVADVISREDLPNPELLSLVLNCLYALSNMELPELQIKAVFELRSACIAGYTPDLSSCIHCGNPFPDRLDLAEGILECASCRLEAGRGIRMPVLLGTLEAMRYICSCDSKKMFAFHLGEDALTCLSQITESYLTTQLEHGFSTLDFYKTLLV